jgi:hypothetical protein
MQRATTTGLPGAHTVATGQFRTPAMDAMVQEAHRQLAKEAVWKGSIVQDVGTLIAQDAVTPIVCKRAVELLDGVNKRFDLWCKLEHDLPCTNQPSSHQEEGHESRGLTAVLRGGINGARQHDIYLVRICMYMVAEWRYAPTSTDLISLRSHSVFVLDAGSRSRDQAMAELPHIRGEDAWPWAGQAGA